MNIRQYYDKLLKTNQYKTIIKFSVLLHQAVTNQGETQS